MLVGYRTFPISGKTSSVCRECQRKQLHIVPAREKQTNTHSAITKELLPTGWQTQIDLKDKLSNILSYSK